MFIQVIEGRCSQHDELRALTDQWRRELADDAVGWLGGTYGFTDDGTFLAVVRFESRAAAEENSARPEQGEWARKLTALMDGEVDYHDSDDVTLMLDGGSDDAGFVQVIRGRTSDPEGLKGLMTAAEALREIRPEIIGATLALSPDGTFTETVAFTDEAAAREGEQGDLAGLPEEARAALAEAMAEATFHDLRHPWFESR